MFPQASTPKKILRCPRVPYIYSLFRDKGEFILNSINERKYFILFPSNMSKIKKCVQEKKFQVNI